jgi:hypothetical protein
MIINGSTYFSLENPGRLRCVKKLRVCLVAYATSEFLSPLIEAAPTQGELRFMFSRLALLKQVVLICCLVAFMS